MNRSITRYNVRVTGYAYWPSEETKIQFGGHELVLTDTKETEKSVHINLRNVPDVQALTLINRFLSILSWCDGQAMQNEYGWSAIQCPVFLFFVFRQSSDRACLGDLDTHLSST